MRPRALLMCILVAALAGTLPSGAANLALDHGWGEGGSRGWFMAMTEGF